jgi:arylsulfatase A-like enzyme
MKKSSKFILFFVLLPVLIGSTFLLGKSLLQRYTWEINYFLYGKKESAKQEFIYHTQSPEQKSLHLSSSENPNIILISLDTLRAQSMSCYGHAKKTTPFLDQLAQEGVLCENMCAASTSTPPSHMSMMTGLYLGVHGVLNEQVLDPGIKTLPEILSATGYSTCAVTENGFLVRDMGFGRGFDDYFEIKDVVLFDKLLVAGGFAKDVFERGKAWIEEKQDQKFFLFLHTYEVHSPYFPPAPYDTMFLDNPATYENYLKKTREYKGRINYSELPPEFVRAQYEGEARFVDEIIKDFITFLKQQGLKGKTLVIITSDHGEELFEHHNRVGHGYFTYNVESHIPFIMWMPGTIPSGIRIKNQVSNVDILPTLVDFLNLGYNESVQGESLYPLVVHPSQKDNRHVFCEATNQNCVKSLEYKYMDSKELFLYENDPEEQFNKAAVHKDLCKSATQVLTSFRKECQSLRVEKGLHKSDRTINLSETDINKLKVLGYIH